MLQFVHAEHDERWKIDRVIGVEVGDEHASEVTELKARLAALMPESPWHYPEDQVSDASERLLAAEITREQLYRQLHDELPYDSAVRPESYQQRKDGSIEIHQQIVIARNMIKAAQK